jgi:toxin ParE1/3/4
MKLAWTEEAKRDLADIRDYSIERWGRTVASDYVGRVVTCAKACARDPRRLRTHGDAYRFARAGSHFVFVSVQPNRLVVVRILHQSMDLARHLPEPGEP